MRALHLCLIALMASSSLAFSVLPMAARASGKVSLAPAPSATTSTQLNLMTKEETEKLLTTATDCAEGECSLDEVQDLIDVLKVQQKELYDRVQAIRDMIQSLEIVNTKDSRKVDEVRETVRAIYRIFQLGDKASGNDYPKLSRPTGWSGDVGKGSQTAYDALPPKKYKP